MYVMIFVVLQRPLQIELRSGTINTFSLMNQFCYNHDQHSKILG